MAQLFASAPTMAQSEVGAVLREPWPSPMVATLRSFFERAHVDDVMLGMRRPDAGTPASDAVARRASALGDDPEALFRFVQQHIAFQAYAGSVLGARGSLRAARGNALDQAMLLVSLCRSAGRRARLVRGRLRWQDAVRLVGSQPAELATGDPWLRRIEIAADHWWAEVEGSGGWVAMDPSFPDTEPGKVPGVRREIHDEPPAGLVAMARLTVLDPGRVRELARYEMPVAELVGTGAQVDARRAPPEAMPTDGGDGASARADGAGEATAASPVDPVPADGADAADELDRYLEERQRPIEQLRVRVGSRERSIPVADLDPGAVLELRFSLRLPLDEPVDVSIGFRPSRETSVAIVVESGTADLGAAVLPVYRMLQDLSEQEMATLVAYRERPGEGQEPPGPDPEAASPPTSSTTETNADAGPPLHPARALHLAALRGWERFDRILPGALGQALLAAGERLRSGGQMDRLPVRLMAVRWRPADREQAGEATVWATDEVALSGLPARGRRAAESAFGFLQSAMMGQVLHQVADHAPLTAFDLTLRSVGTGQRLLWVDADAPIPDRWPAAAAGVARADRRLGRVLVGPSLVEWPAGTGTLGWWAVDRISGDADGRVVRDGEVVSAAVRLGTPLSPESLESALASLPDLHDAGRWLVRAADVRTGALEALLPGACAATTLVSELLSAGAPADLALPDFATFCAAVSTASGGR